MLFGGVRKNAAKHKYLLHFRVLFVGKKKHASIYFHLTNFLLCFDPSNKIPLKSIEACDCTISQNTCIQVSG